MSRLHRSALLLLCLVLVVPAAVADSFRDDFDRAQLGPEWLVVPYTGPLPRAYGYNEPANLYSLTARPGFLRYTITHMTHGYGFMTGYGSTLPGELSCCVHDAGLELHRSFTGDRWVFETKIESYLPSTNGHGFHTFIYFGDGQPGTYYVQIFRYRDSTYQNFDGALIDRQQGTRLPHIERLASGDSPRPLNAPIDEVSWYRVERDRGLLRAFVSGDGTNWTTLVSLDLGSALDGLPQRLVLSGGGWFTPANARVDYDYVSLQSIGAPPSLECPIAVDAVAEPGSCSAVVDAGIVSSGDPAPAVTCTIGADPIVWPHAFPVGTTSVTCTASNGIAPDAGCAFDVTVRDAEPPAIDGLVPSTRELRPPNHKMRDVTLSYAASDACGAPQCVLSVSSNEPENGTGDGDTSPDWEIVDSTRVRLRAERSGQGTGRTYTITVTCTDAAGNRSTRSTPVTVPLR